MVIVLFGVTGSGKTTIGKHLAESMAWQFVDADDHHSPSNIEKMAGGIPLDDDDRREWLGGLRQIIKQAVATQKDMVLACSALKTVYRKELSVDDQVKFVLLNADRDTIKKRITIRAGHFMNPALLQSQFETLEVRDAVDLVVDSSVSTDACVANIRRLTENK